MRLQAEGGDSSDDNKSVVSLEERGGYLGANGLYVCTNSAPDRRGFWVVTYWFSQLVLVQNPNQRRALALVCVRPSPLELA